MGRSLLIVPLVFLPLVVAAHPGKTDRHGGHQCLKDCAEWDLYYREYHLHDKDGKPVKVARKNAVGWVRAGELTAGTAAAEPARMGTPSSSLALATARATVLPPEEEMPWTWVLLSLLLLLFLVIIRRRKGESARQGPPSKQVPAELDR